MTETTKLGAPIMEHRDRPRGVRMLWPIGGPDPDGFQTYAELLVAYYGRPSYRYARMLRQTRIKPGPPLPIEVYELLDRDTLTFDAVAARRFSGATLRRLAEETLRMVRERHAVGDAEVGRFFEVPATSTGD
jgi:hypothetical protein